MAIFQLAVAPGAKVDSRFVESMELTVMNESSRTFDMLVQASHNGALFFESLQELKPDSGANFPSVPTNYTPFNLLIVTNYFTYDTTTVTLIVRSKGVLLAIFTEKDFDRMP
ncbi:hypothetical protein [Paenibacillus sp. OV219]|uniref:hypothetical protein n=1 Tax=Paenibacillus sp. OV219 TaxID=1884377 RepID=UPI0008BDF608|nr:hypothetical protein [Paenibacillus sp. OV219]SEP13523.1 hypothetical protein SAMN05518847_1195 [Paenibacillus sp. OV219]